MKVTNVSNGPRGVNAKGGMVMIEPGETVDVDLSKPEQAISEGTGWFAFNDAKAAKEAAQADK